MPTEPDELAFDVAGGALHALRWGRGDRVAVALHGITANAMSWRSVGERLPADWSLIALDQRGRGRSRDLPGPFAIEDLARDARDVVAATGAEVLAGHSLGAYVAAAVDHRFAGVAPRLVLVDGGVALPVPAGLSAEATDRLLDATIGPMMDRLRTVFPDEDAYVDVFRTHPAMAAAWGPDFVAYARYDARPSDGAVRASAAEEAVRVSGRELLLRTDDVRAALAGLSVPARLLVATRGMQDEPDPFLPPAAVEAARAATDRLTVTEVPDTNHYTVLLGDGAAGAVVSALTG